MKVEYKITFELENNEDWESGKINMYTDYFGLIIPVSSTVLATIMIVITSYYIGIS